MKVRDIVLTREFLCSLGSDKKPEGYSIVHTEESDGFRYYFCLTSQKVGELFDLSEEQNMEALLTSQPIKYSSYYSNDWVFPAEAVCYALGMNITARAIGRVGDNFEGDEYAEEDDVLEAVLSIDVEEVLQ